MPPIVTPVREEPQPNLFRDQTLEQLRDLQTNWQNIEPYRSILILINNQVAVLRQLDREISDEDLFGDMLYRPRLVKDKLPGWHFLNIIRQMRVPNRHGGERVPVIIPYVRQFPSIMSESFFDKLGNFTKGIWEMVTPFIEYPNRFLLTKPSKNNAVESIIKKYFKQLQLDVSYEARPFGPQLILDFIMVDNIINELNGYFVRPLTLHIDGKFLYAILLEITNSPSIVFRNSTTLHKILNEFIGIMRDGSNAPFEISDWKLPCNQILAVAMAQQFWRIQYSSLPAEILGALEELRVKMKSNPIGAQNKRDAEILYTQIQEHFRNANRRPMNEQV